MSSDNLFELFRRRFPADPAALCIETPAGDRWSYAEVDTASARLAGFLKSIGVQQGDRIMAQVDKSPAAVFLYLACLRGGFIYVPLNTGYTLREIHYFIENAQPRVIVCRPESRDAVQGLIQPPTEIYTLDQKGDGALMDSSRQSPVASAIAPCAADDIAAILYTSGTTGRPKGAMITHDNLASNVLALHQAWGWRSDDVLLHTLPIYHAHGLFVACHCVLLGGGKMLFPPSFDPATVVELLPYATVHMGVPTYYTRLLSQPGLHREACRSMRLFISGSAPLLESTFHAFRDRTGHAILERYGMTETQMNTSNPLAGERRAGTVGMPLPGVSVRIIDENLRNVTAGDVGQLLVKGRNVFKGYWRLPEQTAQEFTADGYFKTGDLARTDADGYLVIVGRAKDLVITGGLNVYPKEVETAINEIDGVAESAVIGVPDPDFGEAVTAIVVKKPGRDDLTDRIIIAALKERLASFKMPKRIFFVDSLPINTMGKVQKNVLRERYAAG